MSGREHIFFFDQALLPSGWAQKIRMMVADGIITAIAAPASPGATDERHAIVMPGMPNLHSHAFQRGMAGLAEVGSPGGDSFWTWRDIMYRFVDRITPDDLAAIAAQAYVEMLEGGFTRVGEFHYLHHDRDGRPYADAAEASLAIMAAAAETGIGLTHLPVFYAHSGFGGAGPSHAQRRFLHDIDGFATLLDRLRGAASVLPDAVIGLAPHSLRAVTPDELAGLVTLAGTRPIHIHIAEQTREVEDCLSWSGARPVQWLLDHAPVDDHWCLVHATHIDQQEIAGIASCRAVAGLCPITEANLGDGIFPAADFAAAQGHYGIGSDSNVLIDATEELRLLEYGQRLLHQSRNILAGGANRSTGDSLYTGAVAGGARALGVAAGLSVGAAADFISLDARHPSLANRQGSAIADALIFAGGRSLIDNVWRRGRLMVTGGRHRLRDSIAQRYTTTITRIIA